ncbi:MULTISPECIES: DUF4349 domain-containing protein [unclassified Fusibacter]|uniref:DUF4349 domain-containing protein n=1 Tax=unclassified Fusibacter TaxID=2624464 RepID=UPI001011D387|nr:MULTISPECIES: DUF4349 domain-containing protein [unclassified Fusibacter]MCK8060609.1 DUF4349 domain-containing protein [Fusibacter sp. A2]NPE22937.1 DUF4349 domain-containing protein [Fusibacter sp. A1]RXV60004.1 DUF4349 domain-containing protein [Fusibacter sp. A1]
MKCKLTEEQINDYLDHLLNEEEVKQVETHLAECDDCRELVETGQMVMKALKELPMKTLPEGFEKSLHAELEKVSKEIKETKSKVSLYSKFKNNTKTWQRGLSYAAAVFVVGFIGLGTLPALTGGTDFNMAKSSNDEMDYAMAEPAMMDSAAEMESGVSITFSEAPMEESFLKDADASDREYGDGGETVTSTSETKSDIQNRKLIKSGQIQLEVLDYDQTFEAITHQANLLGGYVENSYTGSYREYYRGEEQQLKEGYIVIRIPQDSFDSAFTEVAGLGEVISKQQSVEDITSMYRDTMNEVKNLEVRETALREIMNKAENVTEIIEVERELSRVRNDINRLTGNLQAWDRLVSLSSIHIGIKEVKDLTSFVEPVDPTVFTRAKEAFIKSTNRLVEWLENTFVGFIGLLPILLPVIILGAVIAVVLTIIRKRRKSK